MRPIAGSVLVRPAKPKYVVHNGLRYRIGDTFVSVLLTILYFADNCPAWAPINELCEVARVSPVTWKRRSYRAMSLGMIEIIERPGLTTLHSPKHSPYWEEIFGFAYWTRREWDHFDWERKRLSDGQGYTLDD